MKGLDTYQKEIIEDLVVQRVLPVSPGVLEKDFLTTEAIRAVASVSNDDTQIIFCGGTCLAKAHKIVGRMSEDADFRVAVHEENTPSYNRRLMGEFKRRLLIALQDNGFVLQDEHCKAMDNNNNIQFTIPYKFAFSPVASLRPFIKIDFIKITPLDTTAIRSIRPLAEEMFNITSTKQIDVRCIGIRETLAEKSVALLRRLSDDRTLYSKDIRLLRHLYDIDRIIKNGEQKWEPLLQELFNAKIQHDSQQFAIHCAGFATDPAKTMRATLSELRSDPSHAENYAKILSELVFEKNPPAFESAMATFENVAELLLSEINDEPLV